MKNKILRTSIFEKRYKRFSKKYHSLTAELGTLEKELTANPMMGESLGNGLYKIRLANSDKNKGKSAGYRVVTYLVDESNSFDVYFGVVFAVTIIGDFDCFNCKEKREHKHHLCILFSIILGVTR